MTILPVLILIIEILASGLRISQEYQRAVVFKLGRFNLLKVREFTE